MVENIFKTIHDTCESMNITVIGGHTEITSKLDRPIVIGSLLGEVEKDKLVKTSGAKIGDVLILTKGIFIEGTSIIGREKEEDLRKKGLNQDFIDKCKNYLYNPGISIYKDALIANKYFTINSMHDPTEGGLANAVAEMSMAANIGVLIEESCINILPEPLKLSKIYNLNPLGTISSGSLLIAIENINDASLRLIDMLKKNGLFAEKIGIIVEKEKGLMIKQKNGKIKPLLFSSRDEITKIF
jgi:hydrogenase maturation factor